MEVLDRKKKLRRIAAAVLLLASVWQLGNLVVSIENFRQWFSDIMSPRGSFLWTLERGRLCAVAGILLAIGIWMENTVLSTILRSAGIAIQTIFNSDLSRWSHWPSFTQIYYICILLAFVCLLLTVNLRKRYAVVIGTLAAVLRLGATVISEVGLRTAYADYHVDWREFLTAVLLAASYFLIGLALNKAELLKKEKPEVMQIASSRSNPNTIENLTQLKRLLDVGAITQEEFDAKKKQLLGQ